MNAMVQQNSASENNLSVLKVAQARAKRLSREDMLAKRIKELEALNAQLESLVSTDPLTGLLNRRGLEQSLARTMAESNRKAIYSVVALLDLDSFKRINDQYGHSAGDEVLKTVAQTIKENVRAIDSVARIGGDEFVILMPSTCLYEGTRVAERIRQAIASLNLYPDDEGRVVTTSIGIERLPLGPSTVQAVVTATESALHTSKTIGKNCVSVA